LGGLTYFDKVIQYRNRTKSNPVWAWDTDNRESKRIEVFNGEIGFAKPHAFDKNWHWKNFRPVRFQIVFKRKEHLWVDYNSKSDVEENLEPAYAISVHKSQGSEFSRVYFILPKHKKSLLTTELLYTGLTRAKTHCTVFIEEDIAPLLTLNRPEYSQLNRINSSLFEFNPVPEELMSLYEWYEEGKIHKTLAEIMVHSKSEVIIANMLFERGIPFKYDVPLFAPDGTFYRPDFVIVWSGEEWYWEHLGMLDKEEYRNHWEAKKEWYDRNSFSDRLITTKEEKGFDSKKIDKIIKEHFS
jgi:exodeoxyribonuclease V alpha subunit